MEETVRARGHENVSAQHASTFEVTSDDWLTPAGDCILAVDADRTPADFDPAFVRACQDENAHIVATFEVDGSTEVVEGHGHPELTFEGDRSMVGRTSDHTDDRTVMLGAAFAAEGFDREMVEALADGAELTLTLRVDADGDSDTDADADD
ncbi:hypothetical protein AUR64_09400 [Haloprofundus marisrubri]|uniref:DUF371 domain-containing protein n=1 Tax=Haloprofundus marisrubri TaxID=1514971 RepID=A0A0W1R953_9EURY|nr:DUF371 domain-containing protein [Haloprofundus marisrubri]KTG09835.1 hypothetical protein AUR64_09400 [Haloprofundus marisrubri]